MRNLLKIIFSLGIIICTNSLFAQSQEEVEQYIDKYKRLAMEEQLRSGVPAAITLAQGIHEATAGQSELATQANNHFGIKCKSTWTGMTYLHDDDAKQECFRKYASAEQSYIDHSDFLKNNNRYAFLFDLDVTDYQGWAAGLKRAGYATNPSYVRRLTDLIEKYNLQEYTNQAQNKKFETKNVGEVIPEKDKNTAVEPKEIENPIVKKTAEPTTIFYKGLKGFYAKKGEMLLQKAVDNNIRYARLLQINELNDEPLPQDMFVYIEKKRKVGTVEFHTVQKEETMHSIAQQEAMQLENLYTFNNMTIGQEPAIGEQINLQYKAYGVPKLKTNFLDPLAQKEVAEEITPTKKELVEKQIPVETPKEVVLVEEKKVEETQVVEMPIKNETPKNDIEQKVVVKTEPINEEIKKEIVIDENSPITDIEKAKRVEQLLSKEKRVEKDAIVKEEYVAPVIEKAEPKTVVEVKEIPIEKKQELKAPKRTYNEKNVDDGTKILKQKFDEFVYKPLPERKIVEKTIAIKDSVKNKTIKKEVQNSKTGIEKNIVKKTPTGIVREIKKEDPKKESIKKEVPSKLKTEKGKLEKNKKEDKKIVDKKEEKKDRLVKEKNKKEEVKKDKLVKEKSQKEKSQKEKKSTEKKENKTNKAKQTTEKKNKKETSKKK